MIKIIRKGEKKATKCVYCGCEFSYDMEDTYYYGDVFQIMNREQYGNDLAYLGKEPGHGDERYEQYIRCPQCNNELDLDKNVTAFIDSEQTL